MRMVINSAVITSPGVYEYREVSVEMARRWLAGGPVTSYIGYENTREWIARRLEVFLPINRSARHMEPGDEALVVRLRYRLSDPSMKAGGGVALNDSDVELGILRRIT